MSVQSPPAESSEARTDKDADSQPSRDPESSSVVPDGIELFIATESAKLKSEEGLTKKATNRILKLVNTISKLRTHEELVPKNYHEILKTLDLIDDKLGTTIGFYCKFCCNEVLIKKASKAPSCTSCKVELDLKEINNKDHFWFYDFGTFLRRILSNRAILDIDSPHFSTIKSVFDGRAYRDYVQSQDPKFFLFKKFLKCVLDEILFYILLAPC